MDQIEKELAEARTRQASLKAEKSTIADRAEEMRASYKTAVESGEDDDKLDAMDKELYQLGRQHTRVEIRLNQCNIEIENLFHAREAAHAEEDRAKYDEDAQLAVSEAKEIEQAVQGLMARVAAYSGRLGRMRKYCEAAGVPQVPFKLKNLERRVTTIFNGGKSDEQDYEEPYARFCREASKPSSAR